MRSAAQSKRGRRVRSLTRLWHPCVSARCGNHTSWTMVPTVRRATWVPCSVVVDGALKLNYRGRDVSIGCGAMGVPETVADD